MQQNIAYTATIILSFIILLWTFFWKGTALWIAAKYNQRGWFIFLLICILPVILFNGIGIIDIVYLFFFAKKRLTFGELKSWKKYLSIRVPERKNTKR